MDLFRLGYFSKLKNDGESGQSTVEYILLFAVVIVLISFVFKSDKFKELFGKNGRFAGVYKREIEYSYRHGLTGRKGFETPNYSSGQHDSYKSRFFGAIEDYGE